MFTFPKNIFSAIRHEKNDFLYNFIEIVDGLQFNQYETIKKIHKYYNSHYEKGDYETVNGVQRKKPFYNINKWRADVATKQIDVDVKDFQLVSEDASTEFNVYLLEKELKAWLKKSKMGQILNEVTRKLPVYGSVVLRKLKQGAEVMDLRTFFTDQAAKDLDSSRYIIIKHLMSPTEFRAKRGIWDNVDEAIQSFTMSNTKSYENSQSLHRAVGTPYLEVYERYGEVPKSFLTGDESDDDTWVKAHFIVTGIDSTRTNEKGDIIAENGLVLFKEEYKELPFKEVHYQKTEGRWLGIGVVEDVFEAQRMVNKTKNQEDKAMELASMILFQTKDNIVARNVLSDVENGEILRVGSEIGRIDNSNTSLGAFEQIINSYETLGDRLSFSYDAVRGETSPSDTTATEVINQQKQASSAFDYKRENLALFLSDFITDLVFPELQKKINIPHIFRFTANADEMNRMREKIVDAELRKHILETGDIPTKQEYEALKAMKVQELGKDGNKAWLEIEKDFFANLEYEVSLDISGEGRNFAAQLQNTAYVLNELSQNPQILQNPLFRRLLFKQMTLLGMSPSELEMAEGELASQVSQNPQAPGLQAPPPGPGKAAPPQITPQAMVG